MIKEILNKMEDKMKRTIAYLKDELSQIKAGRANPMILDRITVNYYETETPLKQLAGISVPEPRIIQVQPYDQSVLKEIERAIQAANIGINPSNDGKVIRLIMPILTEERRIEISKEIKALGEESKVAVRNERRDAIEDVKKLEKDKEISEDQKIKVEKDVQKIVDEYIEKIDEIVNNKNEEILEV